MAVYTHLTKADIQEFLAQYDVGAVSAYEPICEGVTNTNYFISVIPNDSEGSMDKKDSSVLSRNDKTHYILTLFEKHYKLEELPYFTALMEWWHKRGIPCPKPIATKDGRQLLALREKPALMVSFLEGKGAKSITLDHIRLVGKLAADMHLAGVDFPHKRDNALSLKGWEALIDKTAPRLDEISSGLKTLVSEEYNYLEEHWPGGLPSGPVHVDLFPDNVFFFKPFGKPLELSGVIDPYFSCNDFWAYDLAILVNAWCFDDRCRLNKERVQTLMESYNAHRSMMPEEDMAFPILLRGAALRFLLTRSYDVLFPEGDALITPKDPLEYETKLRFFQEFAP